MNHNKESITKPIVFSRLRNEEYFRFHEKVVKLVDEASLSESFTALAVLYAERFDKLDEALEIIRKSVYTAQLQEADKKRCEAFRGLRTAVAAYLRHFELVQRQAAVRVNNVFWHYREAILKSRNEKAASLTNMLQELRGDVFADLQTLGLSTWLIELEANNLTYKMLEEKRLSERADQFDKNVIPARREVDDAYQSLVKSLDIHVTLNPSDENSAKIVNELNARIESATWPVAQRRGMAAKRKEASESSSSSSSSVTLVGQLAG